MSPRAQTNLRMIKTVNIPVIVRDGAQVHPPGIRSLLTVVIAVLSANMTMQTYVYNFSNEDQLHRYIAPIFLPVFSIYLSAFLLSLPRYFLPLFNQVLPIIYKSKRERDRNIEKKQKKPIDISNKIKKENRQRYQN